MFVLSAVGGLFSAVTLGIIAGGFCILACRKHGKDSVAYELQDLAAVFMHDARNGFEKVVQDFGARHKNAISEWNERFLDWKQRGTSTLPRDREVYFQN